MLDMLSKLLNTEYENLVLEDILYKIIHDEINDYL